MKTPTIYRNGAATPIRYMTVRGKLHATRDHSEPAPTPATGTLLLCYVCKQPVTGETYWHDGMLGFRHMTCLRPAAPEVGALAFCSNCQSAQPFRPTLAQIATMQPGEWCDATCATCATVIVTFSRDAA